MKNLEKNVPAIQQFVQKHIYYVLGIFLLGVFLLDYFLLMKRQIDTLSVLNPKLTLLMQDIEETKNNIQKNDLYHVQVAHIKEQLQKTGYKLPLKEEVPLVLDGISRIATQNKIKIDQMFPGKGTQEVLQKEAEEKYYAFPIQVEGEGSYHNIGRFVDQIEKDNIYKNISTLTIEANPKDPARHIIRVTIKTILLEKIEKPQTQKGS